MLEGFSRIDAFVNVDNGEVLIIEVNTVPGMTPSTVLIHQEKSLSITVPVGIFDIPNCFNNLDCFGVLWKFDSANGSDNCSALSEQPPMYPHQFFRKVLDLGSERFL
ncbi:hypothetical protein WN943_004360 [Citrus x changshan-huyou]